MASPPMAVPRQLSKPPITEALLDIQSAITAPETAYESLASQLKGRYPNIEPRRGFKAEWRFEQGQMVPQAPRDLGFQGIIARTADGVLTAQFRPNGFTLNNLTAYMGGDQLLAEGLRLWRLFVDAAHPEVASRVALRFINQLQLPLRPGDDFRKYLVAPPAMPDGAPPYMSEFLLRVVATETLDAPDAVIVTQQLTPSEAGPVFNVDIDAFRVADLPPDPDALRPIFDGLRALKNRAFFSLLTDDAVNLYI
jgi:uncharacterized protein (TIGR04255 family)